MRTQNVNLIDLASVERALGLSGSDCSLLFGYDCGHWSAMKNKKQAIPNRLKWSIEAHLKLPWEQLERLKSERLSLN
ncbi:MAG: hypothetical protein OEY58_19580 [Gammaproteobacteria bacterium]|nr:hypothetical protein [Gammaproteobacteria bacterium]